MPEWLSLIRDYRKIGGNKRKKISKFKLQIQKLELLFTALFKFSSYYSNSWHYSKYQVLFKFGI